ncbi:conserved hypothetical protein [Shewanella woodyi ATCC 51908]|uniref:Lipoprotein n=1 Tax=Shewanella woodyi (strain ATCC 51908 / MS32) TaxID=392500 RepID=B1KKB2_SHEWM|nr:conserved hypothetical protein [Shewanella woodyi ATCC 51908]
MDTLKKLFVSLVFLFVSSSVSAVCFERGCSNVYVEKLYVNASGVVYVGTSGDERLMTCDAVSDVYSTFRSTDAGGDMIFSTLLAAQLSNKKVFVRTVESSNECKIAYVTLDKQ